VLHLLLIILSVRGDVPVNSEIFLVTDFISFKIKPIQSFKYDHKDRMCIYIFIRVSNHMYINIYIYTVLKKEVRLTTTHSSLSQI
jgi:hypothetical protein